VLVAGTERGVGEGRSKKDAEQAAARVAWGVLVDGGPEKGTEDPADMAQVERKVRDSA